MIPLKLSLCALGPYAGPEEIDFRGLNDARTFLITGPTGGGKTTLFDAMQFALFGQTTGGERSAADMRSDLAAPATRTYVDFRFQLGDQTYRVSRAPEQERPKRRGEGMTRDEHKATLWRITGCHLDDDDCGEVLATRVGDVTQRVTELLGLTAEEFRQIVVLPQDRFRELLTAGSAEREDILRTLFQTRFYARIQDVLNERAKAAGREQQDQRNQISALLQDAELDTAEALRERARQRADDLTTAQSQVAQLQRDHDAATARLEQARRIAGLFEERDQRTRQLAELDQDRARIDQLRARIAGAERAQAVISTEDALAAARRRLESAQQSLDTAAERRATARTQADTARQSFETEAARDPERQAARAEVQRLEALQPRVDRLRQAEHRVQAADDALTAAKNAHTAASDRLSEARTRLQQAEQTQRAAEDAQARLPGAQAEARALAQTLEARDRLDQLDDALASDTEQIRQLEERLAEQTETRTRLEAELEQALETLTRQQAAHLAAQLSDGAPCPVCGGMDHPDPARPADAPLPDVAQLRASLKAAEQAERATGAELATARAQRDARQAERARLHEQLGDSAHTARTDLDARRAEAERTVTRHRDSAEHLETARTETRAAEQEREAAETALQQADKDWRTAASEKAAADSAAEAERRDLPEDLRADDALRARLKDATAHRDALDAALETARQNKEQAERAETAAREAEQAAQRQRDTDCSEVAEADDSFHRALETAGFDDAESYRAARADQEQLDALRREVSDHDTARATAESRLGEIDSQLSGQERPDVAACQAALDSRRSALDTARKEETRLTERVEADRRRIERLEALEAQIAETAETLRRIGWMARVAGGDNPLRTSFERYVMAELLDEILEAATARLSIMSRGRYALYRDTRAGDQRRRGGLDIVVHDDHTGKLRPAATLSGGEGFLASLALALGTSDVVQARSGGVRIDALYIDEGFGSLDSETLDQAMRVILDLQRQSNRIVGMISHVQEMRERIPARLEITGERAGSRIAVRLP